MVELLDTHDICKCVNPSFYILFTTFLHTSSPIRCGDCGNFIPLYKLPKLDGEEEYNSILGWEEEYKACDSLFMLSGVGESFGYRQMSQLTSNLTKEGLDICQKMTKKVQRPIYYYLHKYYRPHKENCPGCGKKWRLGEELLGLIRYKCDRCFIVSNEPNIY